MKPNLGLVLVTESADCFDENLVRIRKGGVDRPLIRYRVSRLLSHADSMRDSLPGEN